MCGTPVKDATAAEKAVVNNKESISAFLREGIPTTPLPEVKSTCPFCGLEIDSGVSACPRCGVPLKGKEEEKKTDVGLSKPVPFVVTSPPPIIVPAEREVFPPAVLKAEPPPEPAEPEERSEQHLKTVPVVPASAKTSSQGFINGRGSAGATGLTNGRGAVNGTGLINGTGMTNGAGPGERVRPRASRTGSVLRRWQFIAVLVAIAVVIPAFIYLSYSDGDELMIDGDFGEWASIAKFGMQAPAALPEVTVDEWVVKSVANNLYVYLKTEGNVMGTSNVDSFFLFIDTDGSSASGYSVSSIGADYSFEFHGWNQTVESAALMRFGSASDRLNWTSWSSIDSLKVAVNADKMEAMATLPVNITSASRFVLLSQDNQANRVSSMSYPVPEKGGALIIEQLAGPGVDTVTGLISSSPSISFARLVLKCEGSSGTVESVSLDVVGASLSSQIADVQLSQGESETVEILVDSSASAPQSLVSARVVLTGVSSTFSDVVVVGEPVRAYVAAAPTSIQIDGAFGDWAGRTDSDNDSDHVANPNINMTTVGSVNTTEYAAFFVSVQGQVFHGTYVPAMRGKPISQGGGGGQVAPRRNTGEDVLRIYVDSDFLNSTGELIERSGKVVGADYLLEIKGVNGAVVSQTLKRYSPGLWTPVTTTITAAVDSQRIELSVISAGIGGATSFAAIVETTDWRARSDWAWTGSVLDPWVVDSDGNTYMSSDGSTWSYLGKPTLEPGDRIVDISVTTDGKDVFLVTNTGRTYYWILAGGTSWTIGQTNPIDIATYSEAVSMSFYSKTGAWLLTKNGSYFYLMDAHKSLKEWTFQNSPLVGFSDYQDLEYLGGTMYALRSGQNTSLNFSGNGNIFGPVTNPTGSTSTQIQFAFVPGTSLPTDDKLFVLCENGNIRYSSNGGQTWSALGNLPVPTGGNTTIYVSLGFDPAGYLWVVTNTGYSFRSTDTTTFSNFVFMGQSPIGGIVAILPTTLVIPELPIMVPVLAMVLLVGVLRIRMRNHRNSQ